MSVFNVSSLYHDIRSAISSSDSLAIASTEGYTDRPIVLKKKGDAFQPLGLCKFADMLFDLPELEITWMS